MEDEIIKGYILFKTGFPENLFKESFKVYQTPQEAEFAKDGYTHAIAKYLIVMPIKIIRNI